MQVSLAPKIKEFEGGVDWQQQDFLLFNLASLQMHFCAMAKIFIKTR
jgi:hypothetical protein